MPKKPKPSTALTIAPKTRTPRHGKGTLNSGNPGNKGGGRHPSVFRQLALEVIDKRQLIERLGAAASGEIGQIVNVFDDQGQIIQQFTEAKLSDQLKAIEQLAKIGELLSVQKAVEEQGKKGVKVLVMANNVKIAS